MKLRLILVAAILATGLTVILIARHTTHRSDGTESASPTPAPSTSVAAQINTGATGFADPVTDHEGRKVMIPLNPVGQPLPQHDPNPGRIECAASAPVTSPEEVMIQRAFDLPLLMSGSDGPSRIDDLVPRGYRRSPQGAALAAWNWVSRSYVGGAVTVQTALKLTALTDAERAQIGPQPTTTDTYHPEFLAPDAFRVLSCDDQYVAVELAIRIDTDGTRGGPWWVGSRVNVLWRDGDWSIQLNKEPQSLGSGQQYTALDGWTRWAL
ncbi:hypothetical protein ACWDUL_20080 [Nocardia niigatensis]